MARDYELGIIVNPDVGDDRVRTIVERVSQTVTNASGQVVRVNAWGRRRLSYPIEHHRDGLYFFFDVTMVPESTTELERSLRVNEDIMRHLLKVRDPRVVAQQRQREAEAEALAAAHAEAQAAQAVVAAEVAQAAESETFRSDEAPEEQVNEAAVAQDSSEEDAGAVAAESEANA